MPLDVNTNSNAERSQQAVAGYSPRIFRLRSEQSLAKAIGLGRLLSLPAPPTLALGVRCSMFWYLSHRLREKRWDSREILGICILIVGHSRSRARASYPSCVTAYPRGSRSRVFGVCW